MPWDQDLPFSPFLIVVASTLVLSMVGIPGLTTIGEDADDRAMPLHTRWVLFSFKHPILAGVGRMTVVGLVLAGAVVMAISWWPVIRQVDWTGALQAGISMARMGRAH